MTLGSRLRGRTTEVDAFWRHAVFLAVALAASPTLAQMKWERRVLIVAAPSPQDPALAEQRRVLGSWTAKGEARDLTIVEVVGDQVRGAGDTAPALRRKFRLPAGFTAILIGKDGGEKLRSAEPFPTKLLEQTIDAMPMRRAGRR
ncbi:DUF4174 domain-containing protein [Sphingomonas aurantiaca]|uniref:DUF4174 domain-containing protein n=1 Tax=Sphingomonas aurantiaca TaxID=185949 RepID=UPI002FE36C58